MNSNEIYQKISDNLINSLKNFKKGDINSTVLNETLILNLSSMCKFLDGKADMNNSVMNVLVPMTKFDDKLNETIKKSSTKLETYREADMLLNSSRFESGEKERFSCINNFRKSIDTFTNEKGFNNTFIRDMSRINNFGESMIEGTLFNESIIGDNQSIYRESVVDMMNRSEMSTILRPRASEIIDDTMSIMSGQTFAKYLGVNNHLNNNVRKGESSKNLS